MDSTLDAAERAVALLEKGGPWAVAVLFIIATVKLYIDKSKQEAQIVDLVKESIQAITLSNSAGERMAALIEQMKERLR